MNRIRQWLSQHQHIWGISIDLMAAWSFTASWTIAVCSCFQGLSLGLTVQRTVGLTLASILVIYIISRKWWIFPGTAALGGIVLWRLSRTDYWEDLLVRLQDYIVWWMRGFPQGDDYPYHIQWVQFLTAVLIGAALFLIMRRFFSFLFLLAGSIGAVVLTGFFSIGEDAGLYPCLTFSLIGLIIVLPRIYARYLQTHNILEKSFDTELPGAEKAAPINRASLQILAVPAALVCVGLAFWMVPEDTSEWQSVPLVHFLWDMGDLFRFSVGRSEGYWEFQLSGVGYQPSLDRLGGPVELSDDILFEVKSELPILLRGSIQDTYTGTGWTDSRNNGRFRLESAVWSGKQKDVFGLKLPKDKKAKELYQRLTRDISFQIYPRNYPYCTIFTAGRAEEAEFLNGGEEIYFNSQGEMFTKNYISKPYLVTGRDFLPRSAGMDQEILLLERLTTEEPSKEMLKICEQYLQLPDSLPQQVRDMAESITQRYTTPYQKAAALCDWLSQNCTYTLSPEPLPDGRDFVDFFLETREGYCVYYASAMTVFSRCIGIPARFVSGFGLREEENENWYYTSEATAHAWTEIYLQNIGWIALDPLGWDSSPLHTPDEPVGNPSEPSYLLDDEDEELEQPELPDFPDIQEHNAFPIWIFFLLFIVIGSGAGVWTAFQAPVWIWEFERLGKNYPELGQRSRQVYQDILHLTAFLGFTPVTGETAFEFAQRVDERLQIDGLVQPMEMAARCLVKLQFGGIVPTEQQIREMLQYHQKLEYLVKLRLGKWMYWWKRCMPCVLKSILKKKVMKEG